MGQPLIAAARRGKHLASDEAVGELLSLLDSLDVLNDTHTHFSGNIRVHVDPGAA